MYRGNTEIERDRDATGKAYLAPMRMPAQKNIELRMCCLLVDLRRVGQENRKFVWWNVGRRLLYIVGTVEMRAVETRRWMRALSRSIVTHSLSNIRIPICSSPGSMRIVS